MLTLHLVRHGRTVFNTERRLQGWCDSPLTADGLVGVRSTASHLAATRLDAAYTSPSGRTRTTAAEILAHHPGTPLVAVDGLKEMSFGDLEASPEDELFREVDARELFGSVLAGTHPGFPGGEPAHEYIERVVAAFETIERAHLGDENVLVVSHGVTLAVYLRLVVGGDLEPLANASVSTVSVDRSGSRSALRVGFDPSGQGVSAGFEPAEDTTVVETPKP